VHFIPSVILQTKMSFVQPREQAEVHRNVLPKVHMQMLIYLSYRLPGAYAETVVVGNGTDVFVSRAKLSTSEPLLQA